MSKAIHKENQFNAESDIYCEQFNSQLDLETTERLTHMQEKVKQDGVNVYYKCFIGKGNNSQLVQTLIRSRFWWLVQEKDRVDKVNFMWT